MLAMPRAKASTMQSTPVLENAVSYWQWLGRGLGCEWSGEMSGWQAAWESKVGSQSVYQLTIGRICLERLVSFLKLLRGYVGSHDSLKLRERNSSANVIVVDRGAQAARLSYWELFLAEGMREGFSIRCQLGLMTLPAADNSWARRMLGACTRRDESGREAWEKRCVRVNYCRWSEWLSWPRCAAADNLRRGLTLRLIQKPLGGTLLALQPDERRSSLPDDER